MSTTMRSLTRPIALLAVIVGIDATAPVDAQHASQPVVIGERIELESRVLGETREVVIGEPAGYDGSDDRYGVVYVMDGEIQFQQTAASARFLAAGFLNKIPELLVVAVAHTDRARELTPPTEDEAEIGAFPTHGGADRFLRYLRQELMPWVEQNYRTSGYRVLAGHSFGGLFAIHTLLTEPGAFDAYIAISPSLQWNGQRSIGDAQTAFDSAPDDLDASLYLVAGDEPLFDLATRFADMLTKRSPAGLRWSLDQIETQSHASVPLIATYRGLETIFDAWDVTDEAASTFRASSSIEDVDELYRRSGARFGLERRTPVVVVHYIEEQLIRNGRLDEAAALMLRDPAHYPLVPRILEMLASALTDERGEAAAIDFLTRILEAFPDDETTRRILSELVVEPSQNAQQP